MGFIAWDGKTYQGQPPAGWYEATDGRWWPEDHPTSSDPFPALNEAKKPGVSRLRTGVILAALTVVGTGGCYGLLLANDDGGVTTARPFANSPTEFQEAAESFRSSAPGATDLCCADVLSVSLADDGEITQTEATALVDVLDELGFSRAVVSRMDSTRALDGTQTAEGDLATAYWTYHPDNGLNVIFEPKP